MNYWVNKWNRFKGVGKRIKVEADLQKESPVVVGAGRCRRGIRQGVGVGRADSKGERKSSLRKSPVRFLGWFSVTWPGRPT